MTVPSKHTRISTADGTTLHCQQTGDGFPILFIHEFAGDHRSFEPQVRHFSRQYRCLSYGARGYPPSDVPEDPERYSQDIAVADALAVLDELGIERAHVVGVSMGGFCALHFGLRHPDRTASVVVAGAGYGAHPDTRAAFQQECSKVAEAFGEHGSDAVADWYSRGPSRVQFQNKDPRGWAEFRDILAEHSDTGARLTMLGVQRLRPSLYDLAPELAAMTAPVLVVAGDEDDNCLEPAVMLKRTIPTAGLAVLPKTGHTVNLEEPAVFNQVIGDFFAKVEHGAWPPRDPRAALGSTMGASADS